MKKQITLGLSLVAACLLQTGCGNEKDSDFVYVGMVADQQQITADPFQHSAWKGLENLQMNNKKVTIKYLESETENEYLPNFDQMADEGYQMIIGSGFLLEDVIKEAAGLNEDVSYVLLDHTFEEHELIDNLSGVDFAMEDPAFLAGYIAANVTETGKIGFIGGIQSETMDRYEYGYRYGADYAANEIGREISVVADYTDTFSSSLKGKNTASDMYKDGCDIILQAAGTCGLGVIESAHLNDSWVIGADVDQYEEAAGNVLISVLKHIDRVTEDLGTRFVCGEDIGGQNFMYGLEEDAVGIPEENPNLTKFYPGLYEKAMELEADIRSGKIDVPNNEESYVEACAKWREL